ncbi:exodeoxyribonuclease I [Sarracenia purpurea var. burkii]
MSNNLKRMAYIPSEIIEKTVTDKASVAGEWVHDVRSVHSGQNIIIGLDCEWGSHFRRSMNNRMAALHVQVITLQLCVGTKCLILQLFYTDSIPRLIRRFLADRDITFAEVQVGGDASKLRDDYGLSRGCTADIQALAMARAVPTGDRPPESSRPRASNEQRRYDVVDGQRTGWEVYFSALEEKPRPRALQLLSEELSPSRTPLIRKANRGNP